MNVARHLPSPVLAPYVRCFMLIDCEAATQNQVLPNASLVLAVQYHGRVHHVQGGVLRAVPSTALTGVVHTARRLAYAPNTATLLVHFTETGAAAFFPQPLHELAGQSVPLDQLLPRATVAELAERVADAPTVRQRLAVMEHFLLSQLRAVSALGLIRQAVQTICSTRGATSIHTVVAGLPLSRDPFEKQFRRLVGTSPKQFATIVRLRWVLAHHAAAGSLTELAHAAGYFDQAHFNKEFRAFTGQTPTAFFAGGNYW